MNSTDGAKTVNLLERIAGSLSRIANVLDPPKSEDPYDPKVEYFVNCPICKFTQGHSYTCTARGN